MRTLSIIVLVVLSSGAGFWLGEAHANRRDTNTARPSVRGNINVAVDGDRLLDAALSCSTVSRLMAISECVRCQMGTSRWRAI